MTDDLLERATRALRETTDGYDPRSGATRARLLDSAEKRARSVRGAPMRWLLAAAAVLVTGTALARVAPYLPQVWRAVVPDAAQPAAPAPETKARARRPKRQAVAAVRTTHAPPPAEATAPPPPEIADLPAEGSAAASKPPPARTATPPRAPDRGTRSAPVAASAPRTVPEGTAAESAELALFRRAQRLHLARDPAALDAWNDYLRIAPQGTLAPEARYNRALCLVRLGRRAEAVAALEPFARGDYHGYRQAEAQALLQALRSERGEP